jgi:WhiB family redox-sensing transcriptional regulator
MDRAGGPLSADLDDWRNDAACRGTDLAVFYHPDWERGVLRRRREVQAKRICERCPVKRPCLDWAIAKPELYGVWGGTSAEERQQRRARLGG